MRKIADKIDIRSHRKGRVSLQGNSDIRHYQFETEPSRIILRVFDSRQDQVESLGILFLMMLNEILGDCHTSRLFWKYNLNEFIQKYLLFHPLSF